MPEHDESGVSETLPFIFEFRAVGPEEFKNLLLGQWRPKIVWQRSVPLTSPICSFDAGPIS